MVDFDPTIFLPKAEQLTPRIEILPNGTSYHRIRMDRPGWIVALSPTTVGTIYVYPHANPSTDAQAVPWTLGAASLPGVGVFFVRHTSGSPESFRVVYEGSPGDAASAIPPVTAPYNLAQINGTIQTTLDLTALYTGRTMAAPAAGTVGVASASLIAAAAGRRFLYVRNVDTGTDRVSLGFGAAAVLDSGITLKPDEWVSFDSLGGIATQEVFAISNAAGTPVAIQTGT